MSVSQIKSAGLNESLIQHARGCPILWEGAVFDRSGYSRVSRELLAPLAQADLPVFVQATGAARPDPNWDPEILARWQRMLGGRPRRGVGVCFHPPVLDRGQDFFEHFRSRQPSLDVQVGYTMFETDRLPSGWRASIEAMDRVMVPSRFVRDTFVRSGVSAEKILVLPHGLDWAPFAAAEQEPKFPIVNRPNFVFLSVFEWTDRKGWDVLLDAWMDAFTARDDVMLLIRASAPDTDSRSISQRIDDHLATKGRTRSDCARIETIDHFVSDAELPSLYASVDAFCLPTRGEGWGIPLLEAMGSGLPTIATRWSGQLDFMTDENSYLVDVESMVSVSAAMTAQSAYYESDHLWAEPSRRDFATKLREVFDAPELAKARGAVARSEVRRTWSAERIAAQFLHFSVEALEASLSDRGARDRRAQLVWAGRQREASGLGEEARQYLKGFDEAGAFVRSAPLATPGAHSHLSPSESQYLDEASARPVDPEFVAVQHTLPLVTVPMPTASRNIARAMFETDSLPTGWAERYQAFDEVWVPSEFNVDSFVRAGVPREKLWVFPECLDPKAYVDLKGNFELPDRKGRFAFLSVFDWTLRKGWDLLLRAWAEAFRSDDPVVLYLKVHSSSGLTTADIEAQIRQEMADFNQDLEALADIVVLDYRFSDGEMRELFASADAYVMPTRGEGWGRPFFESMAAGTPVIGTAWSGQLAFMDDQNSWLLEPFVRQVSDREARETPIFRGQRWAEISVSELAETLRRVRTDQTERDRRALRARSEVLTRFDRAQVAALALERVKRHDLS